jgi:pimeloyl-ACP methyl ester carboxylesterase
VSAGGAAAGDGEHRVRLRDGRGLAAREIGDPRGTPVLWFHGGLGSRLEHPPGAHVPRALGVRLVTVDRPGHGASDFQPGRRLRDWPRDVEQLADALGIDRFAVAGWSAGAPYALACAHDLPHRVTAALVAGAPAPPRGRGLGARARARLAGPLGPPLHALLRLRHARRARRLERCYAAWARRLAAPDRTLLARPEVRAMLLAAWAEGARAGARGVAWGEVVALRAWEFSLHEVRVPVHVWYGEHDRATPPAEATWLAGALPKALPQPFPTEGHLLALSHWQELLATVTRGPGAS